MQYFVHYCIGRAGKRVSELEASWNVMAHAQKPDFVFRRNGRVHLNRRVRQFSRLLAAEVCASAVVMLDTPCSEVVWGVLATPSIRQFPLQFPSRASPYAITFQLESTYIKHCFIKLMHILILFSHPLVDYQTSLSSAAHDKLCVLLSLPCVLHVPAIWTVFTWYSVIVCQAEKKDTKLLTAVLSSLFLFPVSIGEMSFRLTS